MAASQTPPLIVLAEFDEPGKLAGPLVQAGFRTEIVDTADAALRLCGINCVAVVISRVLFRYGITGVELAMRLQSLTQAPRLLLITSVANDLLCRIPGFPPPGTAVLRKPIVDDELLRTVSAMVGGASPIQ